VLSQPGSADVASAAKPVFCIYDSDETDDESPARQIETLTLGSISNFSLGAYVLFSNFGKFKKRLLQFNNVRKFFIYNFEKT
jgi:hypothetical protein